MPKNIFNFTIKYHNNSLPKRKNLHKWSLFNSPSCSLCLQQETLQHIVSSCKSYLDNGSYTWRHNSVLLAIAKSLSSLQHCTLFADLPSFASPSLITGKSLSQDKTLYLLELTVGFETNILTNSKRKSNKYNALIKDLNSQFSTVHFVNLSMGALGYLGTSSLNFYTMLEETGIDKAVQRDSTMKLINIAIRCSYYIFCRRNKEWTNPDLIDFELTSLYILTDKPIIRCLLLVRCMIV